MVDGVPMVLSLKVAEKFGKPHKDVMKSIRQMECSDEFRERYFSPSSYKTAQNKDAPCFLMTKDGFAFLCMGFTGKKAAMWKKRYIDAFNAMEYEARNQEPSIKKLERLASQIKKSKELAFMCGRELADYKRTKKDQAQTSANQAQTKRSASLPLCCWMVIFGYILLRNTKVSGNIWKHIQGVKGDIWRHPLKAEL
ncbi:Rha family transcriptional regulator [Dongshaea marina]|uniref:Rha family transcriptional regulator n=1 Tax=Dongshaea marina TaxID=2047966 RepID=UPI000D3EC182|nr:Rha family transcriptional regulator [Dongshaea marina]